MLLVKTLKIGRKTKELQQSGVMYNVFERTYTNVKCLPCLAVDSKRLNPFLTGYLYDRRGSLCCVISYLLV